MREFYHVRQNPLAGDVVEIRERMKDGDEEYDAEIMLRVVAVYEERVWFKEYGKGHALTTLKAWRERLQSMQLGKLVRGADADYPF